MPRGKLNRGRQKARRVRVGLVVLLGLFLLGYGIYEIGGLFDVFAKRYTLFTLIDNAGGLINGAPVTLAGQQVGQVKGISFIPVEQRRDSANISLRLAVNQNVQDQIRADSRASLRTMGLLGDRYVEISPGSPGSRILQPGDTIRSEPTLDYENVLQTAATTLDGLQSLVSSLDTIANRLAAGRGTIGALLADDRLYERMTAATDELNFLLRSVAGSDGTLARLIRDPDLYLRLDSALVRFNALLDPIASGRGTLGRLVQDDSLYRGLVGVLGRADSTLVGFQDFVGEISGADGTLNRLIEDPALYDQVLKAVVELQALIQQIRAKPSQIRPQVHVEIF